MISGDASELGKISMMVGISAGYYLGVNWYRIKIKFRKIWSETIMLRYYNLKESGKK